MGHVLLVSLIVLIDQMTKFFIRRYMAPGESVPLIRDVLHFTHVKNSGAAFGLFPGQTWLLILFTLVFFAVCFVFRDRWLREGDKLRIAYTLGLAGAGGNLIDRILFGGVTDFIDVPVVPVFNVADMAITAAVAWLTWCMWSEDGGGRAQSPKEEWARR